MTASSWHLDSRRVGLGVAEKRDTIPAPVATAKPGGTGAREWAFQIGNDVDAIDVAVAELENETAFGNDGPRLSAFIRSGLDRIGYACGNLRITRTGLLIAANAGDGEYEALDGAQPEDAEQPESGTFRRAAKAAR